jgi:[citrate (pro-3S)-lyase] ligase
MREILPSRSVDFIEIPRLEWVEGTAVSASSVRDAIRADDWDLVRRLVPPVTWDYLRSPQAEAVLERIRLSDSRH